MRTRRGLAAVAAVVLAAQAGCVSCGHQACKSAREVGPTCDIPTPARNAVHVFFLDGVPTPGAGLATLAERVAENGFAKVGRGQVCHGPWAVAEMKQIAAHDPDARFVLVGYDLGGAVAAGAAREAKAAGLSVAAVILLDPTGKAAGQPRVAPTLVVTSGATTARLPQADHVAVPDASHFHLPAHPTTVAAVVDRLNRVALEAWTPAVTEFPGSEYEHAPDPKFVTPPQPAADPHWAFLDDTPPGVVRR